jgi:asparagine synthase (glutamine-hydrolysing)
VCGIAGIYCHTGITPIDVELIDTMNVIQKHRGPDDAGLEIGGNIGLAHRRLSIIDLSSAGKQPMTTEDGRYSLVFNGEIYNYKELKERYCRGVTLRSSSDTEVLLYVLAKMGVKALPELKGMFALALWDRNKNELLLARDPFGKKPLYYFEKEGLLLFASEVKAILQHPSCRAALDKKAVVQYLLCEYVPEPMTGYEGIKQLPMGSYARIGPVGNIVLKKWWKINFEPKKRLSVKAAKEELDALLEQSIKRRMLADVPVGVLLSGGLDSTTIAWYMKKTGAVDLHSFSISFDENFFDESAYAQQAAHVVGCEHTSRKFGVASFKKYLKKVENKMDIPFGD